MNAVTLPEHTTPANSAGASVTPVMDREFIARNQIVERYLSGRLPARGAAEFERFCRANPELLDELGLSERVNAGLRLLDASGHPPPWEEKPRRFWEKTLFAASLAAAVVVLLITAMVFAAQSSGRGTEVAALEKQLAEQPLSPATRTRPVTLVPARNGPTSRPAVTLGVGGTQFADLKIDVSWSKFKSFKVTIDRAGQGRVAIIHNAQRNSNGHVRLGLNSSALGPGNYDIVLEGLTWRGEPVPQAWATIAITR